MTFIQQEMNWEETLYLAEYGASWADFRKDKEIYLVGNRNK